MGFGIFIGVILGGFAAILGSRPQRKELKRKSEDQLKLIQELQEEIITTDEHFYKYKNKLLQFLATESLGNEKIGNKEVEEQILRIKDHMFRNLV